MTGYKHELYCDPDRHVYKALGCHDRPKSGPVRSKIWVYTKRHVMATIYAHLNALGI